MTSQAIFWSSLTEPLEHQINPPAAFCLCKNLGFTVLLSHLTCPLIAPPRRPTVQSSLAVISAVAKVKSSAPDEVTHTAHCLDTCHCKEPPLDPEVVAKFATFKTENYKDYAMELMIR